MLKQVQHDGLGGIMASLLIATTAFLAASHAEAAHRVLPEGYRWGRCILEVDGKSYLSGRCAFLIEKDGSFEILDPQQFWKDEGYFAQIDVEGASGQGFWNEEPLASHAQAPLGKLKRMGPCWLNHRARICLWRQ
jgi:hypothetical protein